MTRHDDAVDPHVSSTGKPTPRGSKSFSSNGLAGSPQETRRIKQLEAALRGMVGLVQLIEAREPELQENHRFVEALRVLNLDGPPCRICGNEERHPRTELLTCECPAPLRDTRTKPQRIDDYRSGYSAGWSDGKNGDPMQDAAKAQLYFGQSASPSVQEPARKPLSHQLNLVAIRRWVDEGFEKMARYYGQPAPNGFAGEAAAAVWLHVQEIVQEPATHTSEKEKKP